MYNKFYNYILIWIVVVITGLSVSIFFIPDEYSGKRNLFWLIIFLVSNILSIYFNHNSHTELVVYSKKNFPKFYYKYLFSTFWNTERWPFLFIKKRKEFDDNRFLELKNYYNTVRLFQLFQGLILITILFIIWSNKV